MQCTMTDMRLRLELKWWRCRMVAVRPLSALVATSLAKAQPVAWKVGAVPGLIRGEG